MEKKYDEDSLVFIALKKNDLNLTNEIFVDKKEMFIFISGIPDLLYILFFLYILYIYIYIYIIKHSFPTTVAHTTW